MNRPRTAVPRPEGLEPFGKRTEDERMKERTKPRERDECGCDSRGVSGDLFVQGEDSLGRTLLIDLTPFGRLYYKNHA